MQKNYIDDKDILSYCEEKVDEYIKQENYEHSFLDEFPSYLDVEASIMSQIIFSRLLASNTSEICINYTSVMLIDGAKISFDIMNNPNPSSKDYYRLGSIAEKKKAHNLEKWEKIKYTIGNFAPIPNFNRKGKRRHLQLIHNDKNERWDFLLRYCQEHWEDYFCDLYPSFREYIRKTAQHIYIKKVLENLKYNLRGRRIEDVKSIELKNWIDDWDNILKDESKECELINFGEKSTDIKTIEEVIDLICILIKVRGRMIITLLKQ